MLSLFEGKFGGCLADDMGLGKTIQVLALLLKLKNQKTSTQNNHVVQPSLFAENYDETATLAPATSLLILPLSLIHNWINEINRFTPTLKYYCYRGQNRSEKLDYLRNYDLILTSYGTIRNDYTLFKSFRFFYLILDESQYIKNPNSKIFKAIMQIKSEYRLALSGTPIENSLTDLWTQMSFLNPGLLGNLEFFKKEFVLPIEKRADKAKSEKLKSLIAPFILRRTKNEVARELPPLTEKIHFCEMSDIHRTLYEEKKSAIRNLIFENKDNKTPEQIRMLILSGLVRLRLLACHPRLIDATSEIASLKFEEVINNIDKIRSEGHKVLVFSQFVKHLNLFAEYFENNNLPYAMLTGKTKPAERKNIINDFQESNEKAVFLISLKAGGVGLNLTAADYVFLLDPWWNIAAENQAINRAHRIGQDKKVLSYKFVTKNTVEEKILLLQERKRFLSEQFIESTNPLRSLNDDDLQFLLE